MEIPLPLRELSSTPPELPLIKESRRREISPQNPQQLQGCGEIAPMEGLARRHLEGDGQLEATRRLQTGQHLQRPKGGEDHRLTLRLQAEGKRAIQGQTRRSRIRNIWSRLPPTRDLVRDISCTCEQQQGTFPSMFAFCNVDYIVDISSSDRIVREHFRFL